MKLLEALTHIPSLTVSVDPDDLERHARDSWPAFAKWPTNRRESARPMAVVWPDTVEQVALTLRTAAEHRTAVVPYGGGSGVVGAVVCERPHISMELTRLARDPVLNEDDLIVTVGAGTPAGELEEWLAARGFTIGHYPQSLYLATVGGLLATRSSGTFSGWYGNIENIVVGAEVVLGDGEIVRLAPTPRASTGPNLVELFLGSEGGLGVITTVWLRVSRAPEARTIRGYAFGDFTTAIAAARSTIQRGLRPAVVRVYDERETSDITKAYDRADAGPCLALFGYDGPRAVVDSQDEFVRSLAASYGGTDLGTDLGQTWEKRRFEAAWIAEGNRDQCHIADSVEVALNWSRLDTTYRAIMSRLSPVVDDAWAHVSHLYGQGGAVYFVFRIVATDQESALACHQRAWDIVMEEARGAGAAISHHHGIGLARAAEMPKANPGAVSLLTRIKRALDPEGVLNPGKFSLMLGNDGSVGGAHF